MKETDALDDYILQHIDEEGEYLKALYRATHVKLLRPRMASGHLQGRMLKMFVQMIRPKQVLEIGTYSGYSALCLAEGLEEGAMLHTFEINDEQEDFTRPWLENSLYADKIKFYIGDALKIVPDMDVTFDLAFVDGNKRFYVEYYEMILKKMNSGGYIIADNTLWDGHVLEPEPHHTDTQTIGIKKFNDLVAALDKHSGQFLDGQWCGQSLRLFLIIFWGLGPVALERIKTKLNENGVWFGMDVIRINDRWYRRKQELTTD